MAQQVAIVTDGAVLVDPSTIASLGIHVVPRPLRGGKQTGYLSSRLTLGAICLERDPRDLNRLTVGLPSLEGFLELFHDLGRHFSTLVCIHTHRLVDTGWRVAAIARNAMPSTPSVHLFEVQGLSLATAYIVQAAGEYAAKGASPRQLDAFLMLLQQHVNTLLITGGAANIPLSAPRGLRDSFMDHLPWQSKVALWDRKTDGLRVLCRGQRMTTPFAQGQFLSDIEESGDKFDVWVIHRNAASWVNEVGPQFRNRPWVNSTKVEEVLIPPPGYPKKYLEILFCLPAAAIPRLQKAATQWAALGGASG